MARKTRKNTKHAAKKPIEHHHMLLRLETKLCPHKGDESRFRSMIHSIVGDLDMKALDIPHSYYVGAPKGESGMTAFVPIETSHIAAHFWNHPDPKLLHHPESRSLLQFDVYTCGLITKKQIARVLHRLAQFEPTHANIDVINRKTTLHMDIASQWDLRKKTWDAWLQTMN